MARPVSADELDLDAVRARVEAATEGPWTLIADDVDTASGEGGGTLLRGAGERDWIVWTFAHDGQEQGDADAEFIAHARTDIPLLIAALEAADGRIAELEGRA